MNYRHQFSLPLDREISYAVKVMREAGIETYESCEGGPGHSFTEPTIRFYGGPSEGLRAVSIALLYGLPVFSLRRFWSVLGEELSGPNWEMTFFPRERLVLVQRQAERAGLMMKKGPVHPPGADRPGNLLPLSV